MVFLNPYINSTTKVSLQQNIKNKTPLKIAFLDIDSTMTSSDNFSYTNHVRKELEENNYIVAFVTSKTEEIIISEKQRKISPHFTRSLPHLGKDNHGKRFYVDPATIEPSGILDADIIISSTGTNILIKQHDGGYLTDFEYIQSYPCSSIEWRSRVIKKINQINEKYSLSKIHPNENIENYLDGKTDIAPPDYRIELKFKTVANKNRFIHYFKDKTYHNFPVQFTDDSNPLKSKYSLFLTPKGITKVNAVNHVVAKVCTNLGIRPNKLSLFIAGDSYPDLAMGLYGGKNTIATFLLVGKSRLASFLVDQSVHNFADESLKEIKKNLITFDSSSDGVYHFAVKESGKRTVIIGDEAFPNTEGPETIYAFLKSKSQQP